LLAFGSFASIHSECSKKREHRRESRKAAPLYSRVLANPKKTTKPPTQHSFSTNAAVLLKVAKECAEIDSDY
jgi:hypothetical protein